MPRTIELATTWPLIQVVMGHGTLVAWPLSGGAFMPKRSPCCASQIGHLKSMAKQHRQAHMQICSPADRAGSLP